MSDIIIEEIDFSKLMQYESELKEMFTFNIYKYHYPNKEVDKLYINEIFDNLSEHLNSGTTYLLGAFDVNKLIGFIWIYQRPFMTYKRMIINSLFIAEGYRSRGIGANLMKAAFQKCKEVHCAEISTHYATVNKRARDFYQKNGFSETRVEVVKKI